MKKDKKWIIEKCALQLLDQLITPEGKFLFSERELAFIVEREASGQGEDYKDSKVDAWCVDIYKEKKADYKLHHFVDHVVRMERDTRFLSSGGQKRLDEARARANGAVQFAKTKPIERVYRKKDISDKAIKVGFETESIETTPTREGKRKVKARRRKLYLDKCLTRNEAIEKFTRQCPDYHPSNIIEIKGYLENKIKPFYRPPDFFSRALSRFEVWSRSRGEKGVTPPHMKKTPQISYIVKKIYHSHDRKFSRELRKWCKNLSNRVLTLTVPDHKNICDTIDKIKGESESSPECLEALEYKLKAYQPYVPEAYTFLSDTNRILEAIINK